jgi:hypothetical protein
MDRRKFLAAGAAAAAASVAHASQTQTPAARTREYYQLRRYSLRTSPQTGIVQKYFADALIPALSRRGMGPVGAFSLDIGPETPTYYLLIPSTSPESLLTLDLQLSLDSEFQKSAEAFWAAPATAPAFERVDAQLMVAFEGYPKLTPPPTTATKSKRLFQMRTYESPSNRDHVRKVEMFNAGEFDIFKAAGFSNVFFGDTIIGQRMPQLTYMLSFPDLATMDACWKAFRDNPDWKKLSTDQKYAFEPIVSNITNLVLSPLGCSQI